MSLIKNVIYRIRGEYTTQQLIKMGMKVGNNFGRLHGVILDPSHCWLIEIGDNVTLAPRVHILCHDASTKGFLGYTRIAKVKIGNDVFVGAGSVILPGVSIGSRVIIGAGSVVTHDIPEGSVAAGNPAKVIASLDDYLKKESERMKVSPCYEEEYTLRGNVDDVKKREMIQDLEGRVGYID